MEKRVGRDVKNVECRQCRHFHITWDAAFPYGCRAMGFKSKLMPSVTVKDASAMQCLKFEEKDRKNT